MEGLRESEKKEDANHPSTADSGADCIGGIPELTAEDLKPGEDPLVVIFNKLRRHLVENDSTTRALQASQAQYADRRRKQHPKAGIELCEADWPGKKEAVVAKKDMTTRSRATKTVVLKQVAHSDHPLKRRLDFDSSDDDHGRKVPGEQLGDVTLVRVNRDGLLSSDDMPKFLDVEFRPPKGMKFIATELAVATYIFARDLAQGHAFWSLRPYEKVMDNVINLVATMLNDEHHDSVWWLPTTFAQIALNLSTNCKETLAFIRQKYMKYVDETAKAFFLFRLLKERKIYRKKENKCPERSDFEVREPMTSQQRPKSLDYGVWVTQWMQLSELWTSYDLELAVDLVMSRANPIRPKICQRAIEYWDNVVRDSGQKPQKATDNKSPKSSPVISIISQSPTI
ncbi:hypothetical protein AHAS_Ahas03G0126400 [Arachis hypogaea]